MGGTPEMGRTEEELLEVGSLWFRMSNVKSWGTSRRRQLLEGQIWRPGKGSGLGRTASFYVILCHLDLLQEEFINVF